MSSQTHQADPKILGRRTLEKDHAILAGLLHPGLSVLDAGCGTGAITAGIARAVGPEGRVVGIDRDEAHLNRAREANREIANLTFERGDATSLPYHGAFDIVTAARTLQWISEPGQAIFSMTQAAKPGGLLVVLDYNHDDNSWNPAPPEPFQIFYRAFLEWRRAHGWDNAMAAHLPDLFHDAGLTCIESHPQNESTERGDADFDERSLLWREVIANVGDQIAAGGCCAADEIADAQECYASWIRTGLRKQILSLAAVTGQVR